MFLNKHLHRMWITLADILSINIISRWLGLLFVGVALNFGAISVAQAATNCNAVTEISLTECESLLELYNSTDSTNWTNNEGWGITNTPCSWYGIICVNGSVSKIFFDWRIQPNGTIPDFSALSNLKTLILRNNWFLTKVNI